MSKLTETIEVKCPAYFALHHAERYFSVHRRGVTPGTIALRVDFSRLKLPGTSQARHDVRVEHKLLTEGGRSRLSISWNPHDRVVPSFAGTLHCKEAAPGKAILTLEGTYDPPFGIAGAAFDLVAGRRIASATMQTLLEDIKEFVEVDFETARLTSLASAPKE
jgi:hypothetical protein